MPIVTTAEFSAYMQAANGVVLGDSALAVLKMLQPMVERQLQKIVGFTIAQNTYTEYHPESSVNGYIDVDDNLTGWDIQGGSAVALIRPNRGLSVIQLRNIPVRTITAVYENIGAWLGGNPIGDFPADTLLPPASYYLDQETANFSLTGQLIRTTGGWSSALRTVQVTYFAGLTPAELADEYSPLKMAALICLADAYSGAVSRSRTAQLGGTPGSVSIEDFSIGFQSLRQGVGDGGSAIPQEAMTYLSPYINLSRYFGR